MKNILVVDENLPYLLNNINFPVGGASVQTRNWMYGFEDLGYNIIINSSVEVENSSHYIIERGSIKTSRSKLYSSFSSIFQYYKILKKYNPEFIYISIPWWTNFLIIIAAKILNIRIVQRISNDNLVNKEAKNRFNNKFKYFLYKISLKLTNVFLCQNNYQLDLLKKRYSNKIVKKLYNPFLLDKGRNYNNKSRNYVAWIGLFQYQKNLPALLKIVERLPEIQFKVAGKSLSIIDLETEVALNKLKKLNNVEFVGLLTRNEVFKFLSKAHCLLNTSHVEGFSNTYLEAFSAGTPVVTRHRTDPDNIILKYNLGKSVKDYSELPTAIAELINTNVKIEYLKNYLLLNHNPMILVKNLLNMIRIN